MAAKLKAITYKILQHHRKRHSGHHHHSNNAPSGSGSTTSSPHSNQHRNNRENPKKPSSVASWLKLKEMSPPAFAFLREDADMNHDSPPYLGNSNHRFSFEEAEVDHGGTFPKTYLVIRLAPNIRPSAVTWLVRKITGKKQDGGAELLVRCEPFGAQHRESLVLHVTASKLKFLECAEYLELKKLDMHGVLREFNVLELDSFLHGSINLENILSPAEKQLIVMQELDNLRAIAGDRFVPGYPEHSLHVGQSIMHVYGEENLILDQFHLHDEEELDRLANKWYRVILEAQPFGHSKRHSENSADRINEMLENHLVTEDIRKYFGDSIALYFSFLGFYTVSLVGPAIFGIVQFFLPESTAAYSLIFFCIFNVIWCTITQELWKRKCSELAYIWGTLRMTKWEDPRSNYRGEMAIDPVTGRYQPVFPWWKTMVRVYCVSLPLVLLCIVVATWIMLYSIWVEEALTEAKQRHGSKLAGYLTLLPSIVYAALVWIMNFYYRKLATWLTEWENHRTQSQFERNRVTKLVLFEFVNNFMSLFYLAFYIQDFDLLRSQVTVMLIAIQSINHFQEALLPLVIRKGYVVVKEYLLAHTGWAVHVFGEPRNRAHPRQIGFDSAAAEDSIWSPHALGLQPLDPVDPRIETCRKEQDMDPYEGTFDDYLEMFIQFGYVFLFSAVSPLAAVWAIINNLIEIRADAFKLCKVSQRPGAKRVRDIGAWQIAFEVMGGIAVITNCALLSLSAPLRSYAPNMTSAEWLLLFVIIEHCLLALKFALRQLIPDVPGWVKIALACLEYRSRQALKHEQTFKSRRQLTRRFKTIHADRKAAKKNNPTELLQSNDSINTVASSGRVVQRRKNNANLTANTNVNH